MRLVNLSVLLLGVCLISCSSEIEESKPNVLLLVADDLAYPDFSFMGSDIQTPTLDSLAGEGIFFGRFHTAPVCTPSYSMLLSGNDNHIAGMGAQWDYDGSWGYEGKLSNRIITFPELLQANGYNTFFAGKWGMGTDSINLPPQRGFDRSIAWLTGVQYGNEELRAIEDGREYEWREGIYTTTHFVDKLIEYIGETEKSHPFFAMAGFTSPHWPLQVDEEFWKKYQGKFDDGYEALRARNISNLINKEYFPSNAGVSDLHHLVTPWDSLSVEQRRKEAKKMELYAGMVTNLDSEIKRLFDFLRETGKLENTLVIFISDNGAAAEDFYNYEWNTGLRQRYQNDYDNMGSPTSYVAYGPQWAEAGSGPFKYFKGFTTQGGILAPMIISGPVIKQEQKQNLLFSSIQDIAPTVLELAGVRYPESQYTIKGESMVSYLRNQAETIHDSTYIFAQEHLGEAMVVRWPWKIVTQSYKFLPDEFSLHNLESDPGETIDLSEEFPQIKIELIDHWQNYMTASRVKTKN